MQLGASASVLTWALLDMLTGKPSAVGVCFAVVAGLVATSPAATFVCPIGAMLIGVAAAVTSRCADRLIVLGLLAVVVCVLQRRDLIRSKQL